MHDDASVLFVVHVLQNWSKLAKVWINISTVVRHSCSTFPDSFVGKKTRRISGDVNLSNNIMNWALKPWQYKKGWTLDGMLIFWILFCSRQLIKIQEKDSKNEIPTNAWPFLFWKSFRRIMMVLLKFFEFWCYFHTVLVVQKLFWCKHSMTMLKIG